MTRETSIQVPGLSVRGFLVGLTNGLGERQAHQGKAEVEQRRERTDACVSGARRPPTQASWEMALARGQGFMY